MPLLSVLIPTYNRELFIAQAIASVISQPFTDLEIIISDNASTDRTISIVEALAATDSRIKIHRHSQNLGPLKNWKNCLQHATGSYVHWLWSDDYIEPDFYTSWQRLGLGKQACFQAAVYHTSEKGSKAEHVAEKQDFTFSEIIANSPRQLKIPSSPAAYILPTESVRRHFYDNIPQTKRLRCIDTAIGPDLLMVLGCLMDTDHLIHHPKPSVHFRNHAGSISTQRNKALKPHYIFALAWFIQKHKVVIPLYSAFTLVRKGLKYKSLPILTAGLKAMLR